jgi:T-complex protein 1 subunit gamma
VADVVRTTLGPRSMLKMILDPMGGIVLTNDGNSILREIDVSHPAARSIIDLSRTQDEEVGDGTTSVIIVAGEILSISEPLLERKLHPTVIVKAFFQALNDALKVVEKITFTIDVNDTEQVTKVIKSCLGTKFLSRSSDLLAKLALEAVMCVTTTDGDRKDIDLKRYAKVEKVPGGVLTDSRVLRSVMFNKDIIHSSMRRKIDNPRVVLLDCPVEYRKGESMTSVEVMKDEDWAALLKMEEDEMERMCADILKHKPDVLITEKGISGMLISFLAISFFLSSSCMFLTSLDCVSFRCNTQIMLLIF